MLITTLSHSRSLSSHSGLRHTRHRLTNQNMCIPEFELPASSRGCDNNFPPKLHNWCKRIWTSTLATSLDRPLIRISVQNMRKSDFIYLWTRHLVNKAHWKACLLLSNVTTPLHPPSHPQGLNSRDIYTSCISVWDRTRMGMFSFPHQTFF